MVQLCKWLKRADCGSATVKFHGFKSRTVPNWPGISMDRIADYGSVDGGSTPSQATNKKAQVINWAFFPNGA